MNRASRWVAVLGVSAAVVLGGCKQSPAEEHRALGDQLYRKQKFAEAAVEYDQSLAADPKQERLWEKKAMAHIKSNDMEKADQAMLKLLDFKTDNAGKAEVYRNLASVYLSRSDSQNAAKYFEKVLELNPTDDLALPWMAEIYSQQGGARGNVPVNAGYLERAFEYFDRAIAAKPEDPNPYINKRIAMLKYISWMQDQKTRLEDEAKLTKDKARVAELKTQTDEQQKKIDQMKADSDVLLAKFKELRKNAPPAPAKK